MHCGKTWISSLVLMSTFRGTDLPVLPISSRPCAVVLDIPTDIQGRSQTSHTIPCNGIISHGAQIGGIWVFANHTRNNKAKQMHLRSLRTMRCFYACLSSQSDCSRLRGYTHLTNHSYFDYTKIPKTPNLSPMLG